MILHIAWKKDDSGIFLASFKPIFVKKLLNSFAVFFSLRISVLSVTILEVGKTY